MCILMHITPKKHILFLQPLYKALGSNNSCLLLLRTYLRKQISQAGQEILLTFIICVVFKQLFTEGSTKVKCLQDTAEVFEAKVSFSLRELLAQRATPIIRHLANTVRDFKPDNKE